MKKVVRDFFTSEDISQMLSISRVTLAYKVKLKIIGLKVETFKIQVRRYRWKKEHIKRLIETFRGKKRRRNLLRKAKKCGLI